MDTERLKGHFERAVELLKESRFEEAVRLFERISLEYPEAAEVSNYNILKIHEFVGSERWYLPLGIDEKVKDKALRLELGLPEETHKSRKKKKVDGIGGPHCYHEECYKNMNLLYELRSQRFYCLEHPLEGDTVDPSDSIRADGFICYRCHKKVSAAFFDRTTAKFYCERCWKKDMTRRLYDFAYYKRKKKRNFGLFSLLLLLLAFSILLALYVKIDSGRSISSLIDDALSRF